MCNKQHVKHTRAIRSMRVLWVWVLDGVGERVYVELIVKREQVCDVQGKVYNN